MQKLYVEFIEKYLAIPLIKGEKTTNERFAGAETTYTVEALMQDGKALQLATTHFLGQNFAKAFNVTFTNKKSELENVYGTSSGVSTRLIGALVMMHADDHGLVLPPKIAPIQVIIISIKSKQNGSRITTYAAALYQHLQEKNIRVK
jgi:prolyl-tRNA synthetase